MTATAFSFVAIALGVALGALLTWLIMRTSAEARVEAIAARLKGDLHEANARIAETQRDSFLALAGERFNVAFGPVQQKLNEFDALVQEMEKERIGAYEGLREQIGGLIERSGKMELAASQLASALRNPMARGKWGEVQLRRVAELAGMERYCDFCEQQSFESEEDRSRPDMTVQLPGDRCIFVDAKVPLTAYLDASEAADETARRAGLRAHASAFKGHVDLLARRNYQRAGGSADFVVMFVPGEAFLSAACVENPELIEYGAGKSVYIASPLTLMALLRSYALGWQHRAQEENAKQIAIAGRELYDRVRVFAGHLAAIGGSLSKAVGAFNAAVASMESRVLPQGRRIKELAALADADLPDVQAVELAPRDMTALDAQPRDPRGRQREFFRDDGVA